MERDYGTIIYIAIIVIGVVFSLVQALLKGKKINLNTLFTPPGEDDYAEFDDEPLMVVDAQGNIIQTVAETAKPPPQPPKKQKKTRPTAAKKIVMDRKKEQYQFKNSSNGYVSFIRGNARSAVIMHEILGKPKALQ